MVTKNDDADMTEMLNRLEQQEAARWHRKVAEEKPYFDVANLLRHGACHGVFSKRFMAELRRGLWICKNGFPDEDVPNAQMTARLLLDHLLDLTLLQDEVGETNRSYPLHDTGTPGFFTHRTKTVQKNGKQRKKAAVSVPNRG